MIYSTRIVLTSSFFNRPTVEVARSLLGCYLVMGDDIKQQSFMINEVEAYDGPEDLACHARVGKTKRTAPMFGPPGHFYVYFIYGMYWMLNVVVGPEGYPAALLIRGVGAYNGPGKLTKNLNLTGRFNNQLADPSTGLWFEDRGVVLSDDHILATPRIGVDYAGPIWAAKPYRFVLYQR